jgi:hypothetical protein
VPRDHDQAFSRGKPASCIVPRFVYRRSEQHCDLAGQALAEIGQRAHLRLFDVGL